MSGRYLLIATENIDATQRRLIQGLVRSNSENWWHEFVDLWIVQSSRDLGEWLRDLHIIVNGDNGESALVFLLPDDGGRRVGTILPDNMKDWFRDVYIGMKKEAPSPASPQIEANGPTGD